MKTHRPMRPRTLPILLSSVVLSSLANGQAPVLLKDIAPAGSSNPVSLTCYNGVHYFMATDEHGRELWRSDGTEAGTYLLKDIVPGSESSSLSTPMAMGDHLYFVRSAGFDRFIWRTDGTVEGTEEVLRLDDLESTGLTSWDYFEALGDRIFFNGYTPELGREVWSTDGTAEGTELFMDLRPGSLGSDPYGFKTYMNKLYFTALLDASGEKHWVTDGTVAGTHFLTDVPSSGGFDPPNFFGVGERIYFKFTTPTVGGELWATDGTMEGTGLVRDLWPGPNSSSPQGFAALNGQFHFFAYTSSTPNHKQIFTSDGTMAGTAAWPDLGIDRPDHGLVAHNGHLYFTAYTGTSRALWRSNGTPEGTNAIQPPAEDEGLNSFSSGTSMCSCNGTFYFAASYNAATGREFYLLDPPSSTAITRMMAPENPPYPNPVTSALMVQVERHGHARLFDDLGREVRTWWLTKGLNTVDLDGLSEGIYSFMTDTGTYRIIKR